MIFNALRFCVGSVTYDTLQNFYSLRFCPVDFCLVRFNKKLNSVYAGILFCWRCRLNCLFLSVARSSKELPLKEYTTLHSKLGPVTLDS